MSGALRWLPYRYYALPSSCFHPLAVLALVSPDLDIWRCDDSILARSGYLFNPNVRSELRIDHALFPERRAEPDSRLPDHESFVFD